MLDLLGETIGPIFKGLGQPYKVVVSDGIQTLCLIYFVWLFTDRYGITGAALAWLPAITAGQVIIILFIHRVLVKPFAGVSFSFRF